ncbi:MAG TPA: hypothetical protein EYQ31_11185, partial [Candidatus Handelsmanbacteria bacterium]|nr:hypothetical protein [Candidatus Handelsmanbacteria bacterium]
MSDRYRSGVHPWCKCAGCGWHQFAAGDLALRSHGPGVVHHVPGKTAGARRGQLSVSLRWARSRSRIRRAEVAPDDGGCCLMEITEAQIKHFERNGFFLLPNPLGVDGVRQVDFRQQEIEAEWERTEFPQGFNRGACQFLMAGELLLHMVERPELLDAARRILGDDDIHVGACGLGDASKTVSADGRPQRQVHWHADGGPDVQQVSLRTALDRHDSSNAPLRVLPGSQHREREEV